MNRTISLLVLSAAVFAFYGLRTLSIPSSDEETLKNLETEWAKHINGTDEDIAFQDSVLAPRATVLDALGNIVDLSRAELEENAADTKSANPDAKRSIKIKDIKVRVYGDTAIVTYINDFSGTGMKDKNLNMTGATANINTWQKQSGKWKCIAGASISTQPIPPEAYQSLGVAD
jgi:ketosteroid isomerase-like protein